MLWADLRNLGNVSTINLAMVFNERSRLNIRNFTYFVHLSYQTDETLMQFNQLHYTSV